MLQMSRAEGRRGDGSSQHPDSVSTSKASTSNYNMFIFYGTPKTLRNWVNHMMGEVLFNESPAKHFCSKIPHGGEIVAVCLRLDWETGYRLALGSVARKLNRSNSGGSAALVVYNLGSGTCVG